MNVIAFGLYAAMLLLAIALCAEIALPGAVSPSLTYIFGAAP